MLRSFNKIKGSLDRDTKENLNKNFGLTQKEFNRLVIQMESSNNSLLHHIYKVHFEICRDYLKERYTIDDSIAYDLFMDALVAFRSKVLNDKITYGNLKFLYTRIAINCYMDYHRQKRRLELAIKNFSETIGSNSSITNDALLKILNKCIGKLKEKDALLLHQLFLDEKEQEALAIEMGISYATLRKRKERALERLKALITEAINKNEHD